MRYKLLLGAIGLLLVIATLPVATLPVAVIAFDAPNPPPPMATTRLGVNIPVTILPNMKYVDMISNLEAFQAIVGAVASQKQASR